MPSYSISAPDGQTYKIDGPEGATQEQIQAEVLRQHPTAGQALQPAPPDTRGVLARGYDAIGNAGEAAAGKGYDLAAPVRGLVSNLNNRLPEWLRDKDVNTATRDEAVGTGRILAQEGATTLPAVLLSGGLGAAARTGATALRAGPLATRIATTAGQMVGGAAGGAGVADAKGSDPTTGAVVGGALPLLPTILSAGGRMAKAAVPSETSYLGRILRAALPSIDPAAVRASGVQDLPLTPSGSRLSGSGQSAPFAPASVGVSQAPVGPTPGGPGFNDLPLAGRSVTPPPSLAAEVGMASPPSPTINRTPAWQEIHAGQPAPPTPAVTTQPAAPALDRSTIQIPPTPPTGGLTRLQEILQRNGQPTSIPPTTPTPPPFKLPEGYTARDFARLSPEAQAALQNPPLPGVLSPTPTTSVPPTAGAPRPLIPSSAPYVPDPEIAAMAARRAALAGGQPSPSTSAGASGQGPSIAPTLQARGIVSGGPVPGQPAAVSSTWAGSYPSRVPPAASPTVADLPMTRAHVATGAPVGTPIGPLPQPGPVTMPPQSGTADILRQDPTLRSALEVSQHWRQMHGKGFAEGGKVTSQDERDYQDAIRQSKGQPAPTTPQPAPNQPADDDVTKQIYKKPPPNAGGYFKYPWAK